MGRMGAEDKAGIAGGTSYTQRVQTPTALPAQPPPPATAHVSRPYNTWAIVSASFAASTILGTWCLGGIIAVITGHVARSQIKRTGEAGEGLALAGLIAGYISIALFFLFVLAYIAFFVFIFAFAATHPGTFPSPSPSAVPINQ
jgi:Domain of unknown function (DUF4190)